MDHMQHEMSSAQHQQQRRHTRSSSLENANALLAKNTLGLPIIHPGYNTGTLKSKNEQRRLKNKFGSQNNLEEYVVQSKMKFQNLRNMFEMKSDHEINRNKLPTIEFNDNLNIVENDENICMNLKKVNHLVKPVSFRPIPFEPDYSIPTRCADFCERYGSTPSLVPNPGAHLKFGSTSDLRSVSNYCTQFTRRRCSRSSKIHDSLESVRQTPDSDGISNISMTKPLNKRGHDQFELTPSPSDSGVSDLEAALKDRDSELAYLRQTMEHNEKAIFKVHKDKEAFWENETRRLKVFIENQQRDYTLKIKKLEQMLTLQSFQFRQNKLRISEDTTRTKEQFEEVTNENEVLRNEIDGLKLTEKMLKDRISQMEEKTAVMDKLIANLKGQLEENEWTVCQKNGEIALLKTLIKEAKAEISSKDHKMINLKAEPINSTPNEFSKDYESELEISQLNRIIIFKDQIILAMTSELTKLRKELSDLAIFHEYGEEPNGKYARLKYKIDSLTNSICQDNSSGQDDSTKLVGDNSTNEDLKILINCIKSTSISPFTEKPHKTEDREYLCKGLESISEQQQQLQNLPDVTLNYNQLNEPLSEAVNSEDCIKTELDSVKKILDNERVQWAQEKEKVLRYQRQLQIHYINMYQKMKALEGQISDGQY